MLLGAKWCAVSIVTAACSCVSKCNRNRLPFTQKHGTALPMGSGADRYDLSQGCASLKQASSSEGDALLRCCFYSLELRTLFPHLETKKTQHAELELAQAAGRL